MTSLKDVTLSEATKYGSLTEFAFFDKVVFLYLLSFVLLPNHIICNVLMPHVLLFSHLKALANFCLIS